MFRQQVAILRGFIKNEYKNIPSVDTIKGETLKNVFVRYRFLIFHI
jgi:hypothetical protein